MKRYVLALLIASFLAISSLGIGVTVITNASEIREGNDITVELVPDDCYYTITVYKRDYVTNEGLEDWEFNLYIKEGNSWGTTPIASGTTNGDGYLIFEGLCSEEHYKVQEEIEDGWTFMGSEHYYENHETDIHYKYDEDGTHTFWIQDKGQQLNNVTVTFYNAEDTDVVEYGDIYVFKFYDTRQTRGYEPDDGDHPLAEWHFELFKDIDGSWVSLEEGWTNESGYLIFRGYELGENYMVTEYIPKGWYNTYTEQKEFIETELLQTLSLDIAEEQPSPRKESVTFTPYNDWHVKFGNAMLDGSITVYKYDDVTEEPLEGWEFCLYIEEEECIPGTTDEEGKYIFWNVYPGDYTVVEILKDGWDNITSLEQEVTVYPDENTDVYFYNALSDGDITVCKYDWDTEASIEGWEFILLKNTTDGWVEVESGQTYADGCLVFEDMSSYEEFRVKENLNGWTFEGGAVYGGTADGTWDPDFTVTENQAYSPKFYMNGGNVYIEFYNSEVDVYGNITVYKFYDANYDGEYDDGEDLIGGFEFALWDANEEGEPIGEVPIYGPVEAEEGTYTFEELEPGNYVVQEIIPEVDEGECCWIPTTDVLQHVYVEPEGIHSVWFGNVPGGRIEGMKFLDVEATGQFEVGLDKPLMGWEIHLYEAYKEMKADIWMIGDHIATTETNRSGQYYFDCVMPGNYFVQEKMYEGWYNVTPALQHVYVGPCETEVVDFANCMYKDIYGIKFYDYNMDGEFNEGDWVLSEWNIYLYRVENEEEILVDETTTDHLGYYYFEGLTVGTYSVREEIREGWISTTDTEVEVVLNCCTPCIVVNFGNYESPEITINKFYDVEMTGEYNPEDGDYLIEEMVQFDVYGEFEGVEVYAELMDVTGTHNFLVPVGDFNVTELLPAGWLNTTPLMQEMSLGPGDHWEVWFGNVKYGNITVYKFYDSNMNGTWEEGEEMLEGWTFNLWETEDGEPVGDPIDTVVTDDLGMAIFEELLPGTYAVQEIEQDCWFPTTDVIQNVEVEAGVTSELWFGNVPGGYIGGYKFCDVNMNEQFDDDECGLEGWEIQLYDWEDLEGELPLDVWPKPLRTTQTGEDGYYNFTCVEPGMYVIREVLQDEWYNSTAWYYEIEVLPEGELRIDFGNYRYGDITGLKFCDFNMNGEFEIGIDSPLCGWEIELWTADEEGNPTEYIMTTYTNGHGYYTFEDVGPGDYVVKEILKECGWVNTTATEVHVRMGCVEEVEVNFGNYKPSDITVFVYDLIADAPIYGAEVELWEISEMGGVKVGEEPIAIGTTGDHGYYVFCRLDPGYYLVEIDGEYSQSVMLRCCSEWVEFVFEDGYPIDNDTPQATYAKIE